MIVKKHHIKNNNFLFEFSLAWSGFDKSFQIIIISAVAISQLINFKVIKQLELLFEILRLVDL